MAEQRKLAAILAADVVGFSRLTGADEDRTLARLRALRSDLIDPTISVHRGRVVKRTGDGVIIEFRSVVDAVRCAIEVQNAMIERNAGVPAERRIEFRIGIHLGDVVEESDGDLMGDGVNIAARLEGVAQPGAICLSEDAYRQVKARLDLAVSDLGETRLKNIADPMRVYSLQVGVAANAKPLPQGELAAPGTTRGLPDKPSIAVLPFQNSSGDPEQAYFSDGITEDIITELSRFRSLFVIARNSSFQFRGPSVDHTEVCRKLGVRHLVEGSIRRLGSAIRLTVQLIDARSGNQLWAERYDRSWQEIFAVQDELVRGIVGTIEGRIIPSGAAEARRKPIGNQTAYDLVLQARDFWNRYDGQAAEDPLRAAIALDQNYAPAHALLGISLLLRANITEDDVAMGEALAHAEMSVKLDPDDSRNHSILGLVLLFRRRYEEAAFRHDRALQLNPNDCTARTLYAHFLVFSGRADDALIELSLVRQRDPYPPLWYWEICGSTYYQSRRYDEAIAAYHKMDRSQFWAHGYLAASYAMAGKLDDARREMDAYRAAAPPSVTALSAWAWWEPHQDRAGLNHLLEGLRKAGLPE